MLAGVEYRASVRYEQTWFDNAGSEIPDTVTASISDSKKGTGIVLVSWFPFKLDWFCFESFHLAEVFPPSQSAAQKLVPANADFTSFTPI